jgi:mRNA interferase MazF
VTIRKFHLYLADLNPRIGTEPGKVRPVVVIQTDLLNTQHPSTLICPLTTQVAPHVQILRVHIPKGVAGLHTESDILVDQIRAVDNRRLKRHLGALPDAQQRTLLQNLQILIME